VSSSDLTLARHIDAVCERFESAWQSAAADTRLAIEEYLSDTPPQHRSQLVRELVRIDLHYRVRGGHTPTPDDYLARFHDLDASWLDAMIAAAVDPEAATVDRPGGPASDGSTFGDGAEAGDDTPPAAAGRFAVRGEIARGGMGVVYRAFDPDLGREVAVKTLGRKLAGSRRAGDRFVTEARITGQLQHPGIPPVHEVGELPDGRPFLAMKLIHGQTLAELLKATPADRPRFVRVFEQVCQTVGFAHEQGVIHRDLKPANVMVGAFGEVQVMDWGLAKQLPSDDFGLKNEDDPAPSPPSSNPQTEIGNRLSDRTRTGSVLGTLAFMPPEQARGEVRTLGRSADVFALGGILCHILTGQPPYTGTFDEVWSQATGGRVEAAFARLDTCGADPELIALAKRCLSPAAADRPADGAAVADAVGAYRAGVEERLHAAEREAAAAAARLAEGRKRRRWQAALAAAVGLLAVGGGAFAWWQDRQAADRRFEQAQVRAKEQVRRGRNEEAVQGLLTDCETAVVRSEAVQAAKALEEIDRRAADGVSDELTRRVERCRRDLAVLRELDRIDDLRWTWADDRYQQDEALDATRELFATLGLRPGGTDAEAVARRVNESLAADRLLGALDVWWSREPNADQSAVLRAADDDPYRTAVRDATVGLAGDLSELAMQPEALEQPARFARVFGEMGPGMLDQPAQIVRVFGELTPVPPNRRKEILLSAHHSEPGNLILLMALSHLDRTRTPASAAERASWYRAALAVRPRNAAVWNNLGVAENDRRNFAEAARCGRQAIGIDPNLKHAYGVLGLALAETGAWAAAEEVYRKAISRFPDYAVGYTNLCRVCLDTGRTEEAKEHGENAVRLDPKMAVAHNNLGQAWERLGHQDRAIASYETAIRVDPRTELAYSNLARLFQKSDPARALRYFQQAVMADPKNPRALTNLGAALVERDDLNRAVGLLREAVRLDPEFALARKNLGRALVGRREFVEAERHLTAATQLIPRDGYAHYLLGIANGSLKRWEQAKAAYETAIRLGPPKTEATARVNLANVLRELGRPDDALAHLQAAVRADPDLTTAHKNLAWDLLQRGRKDDAIAEYKEVVRCDPKNAEAHRNLGNLLAERGQIREASRHYQAAVDADPKMVFAHNGLANTLMDLGDVDGAMRQYAEATRLNADYAPGYYGLGKAWTVKNDARKAIECYEKAVSLDPKFAEAHNNLGMLLAASGDDARAKQCFERAIEANPKLPQPHLGLGNLLRKQQKYAEAIASFQNALRLAPRYADGHANLGLTYLEVGEVDKAIASLKKALELKPGLGPAQKGLERALTKQAEGKK
jgi:tetratricopeptide (TPR) repeat protein